MPMFIGSMAAPVHLAPMAARLLSAMVSVRSKFGRAFESSR